MASIDERVVAMSFENTKFEARVSQTQTTLAKLNQTLATIGAVNGLANIEKSADKITLAAPMSALDKLRTRLFGASQGAAEGFSGIDAAGNKVQLTGPTTALDKLRFRLAGASQGAADGMAGIDAAGNRVRLDGPLSALDKLRSRLFGVSTGAVEGFSSIEQASAKVSLLNPMTALDRLRQRLFGVGDGAAEGFSSIEQASAKVTLAPMSGAVDSIRTKFSGLQIAAVAALSTIVAKVTSKAGEMVKALSIGPISGGLEEYSTNLNSIQTILANTEQSGAGLKEVNAALKELNEYSDKTIYNFSQMAKNIGTFTAAGVDLDTATASIKGIANLAALSGSNAQQASTAMYQLSQEIAAGRVSLQGWNSVVNAGMGGVRFQGALLRTAENMGTLGKGAVDIKDKMGNATVNGKSFRESITAKPGETSWLTSKVLTNTLTQFTGDLSKAEVKAMGFNDAQAKAIMKTAETASKAATEVKTLKGVMDVAQESIGSGWAATFQLIFGNFGEAKKTFTDLSQALGKMIGGSADARNKILEDWSKLGGRTELIEGLKNVFKALFSVLTPIKEAFRDIFPRKTGQDLYDLTVRFREFAEQLKIGPETAENLKRTFRGFFALLNIGKTIISGVVGVIFDLLGVVGKGSGGFLNFTGSIGDFIVSVDNAISKGKGLKGIFKGLSNVLQTPIELIRAIAGSIKSLFDDSDPTAGVDLSASLDKVGKSLGPLGTALKAVVKAWGKFFEVLQDIADFAQPILEDVRDIFSKIGDAIMEGLNNIDYDKVMTFIQTGFLAGIGIGIRKLLGGIGVDLTGGMIENLKSVTGTLTSTLTTIQKNIKAKTMLLIAAAVLALAAAAVIFSQIDAKKLAKAMGAIAVGIGQLVGAMALLAGLGGASAFITLPFIATAMLILAAAVVVLAAAVFLFSKLSWEELAKGLTGVAGALAAIGVASKLIGPSILLIGPGLIPVAIALNLIAVAMQMFSSLSWEEIVKGLLGIGGSLVAIGIGLTFIGPSILLIGPGLIAASIGLILLSGAISSFGNIPLFDMAKGLTGMTLALGIMAVAIMAFPPTLAFQAAGLVILSIALMGIASAIGIMGSLGIFTIVKGLFTLGGALVILAIGLTAMVASAPGAVALGIAAVALAVLTPVLVTLGSLKWGTIAKGLAAIALTLGVLSLAGLIATPGLLALGIALTAVGVSVLVVSTGFYILAKAFTLLGQEGTKGIGIMIAAITAFIALIPKMVIDFVTGLVEILTSLVTLAPKIAESLVKIVTIFLVALEKLVPKVAGVLTTMISAIVRVLSENSGPIIRAGFRLLMQLLSGLANNTGPIINAVAKIINGFLTSARNHLPRILRSGAQLVVKWLEGITQGLPKIIAKAAQMIRVFLQGVTQRLPGVIAKGAQLIATFINSIARQIPKITAAGVRVIVSVLVGIANAIPRIIRAGTRIVISFISGIAEALPRMVDAGFKAIIKFLNGIARAIRENDDKMIDAGWNIASAIGEGLIKGLASIGPKIRAAVGDLITALPKKALKILGIKSPSTVFAAIGQQTMAGMAKGLQDGGSNVIKTMESTTNDVIGTAQGALGKIPNLLDGLADVDPVITPVLDLSNVQKGAKQLDDLTNVTPITVAASYGQAAAISEEKQTVEVAQADQAGQSPMLHFEQNNYSPESLSDVEIYRQTNNQLSLAKNAVGLSK